MWILANRTPFAADFAWVRDKRNNKVWLVIVKGTFRIGDDGICRLDHHQVPVRVDAAPYGEFGQTSLRYESDLQGRKPGTDVLVVAEAVAPGDRPVVELDVALRVGPIYKHLKVFGNRNWERTVTGGLRKTPPQPFTRMPIIYENAYGGWDRTSDDPTEHRLYDANPVGTGFTATSRGAVDRTLPNVEYAGSLIESWSDRPAVAGLNVVDCAWTPRRLFAGTYDKSWLESRFPHWAADFDERYHHAAPADQQVQGFFAGGERVDLLNLAPEPRMSFVLPRVRLGFRTRFGSSRVEHGAELATVLIEPASRRLVLCWQSTLVCNRREDLLDETLIVLKAADDEMANVA